MTSFTIEVQDRDVQEALRALSARVNNMKPVLMTIGADIVERTKHRFDTSTGPDGQAWKPNTPATRKAKGGKPPLIDGGDLRMHIFPSVTGNTLTVSTGPQTAQYAAIQQFGGSINRPAHTVKVRHRTDAKGELLRTDLMNGRGLIFAKGSHKRVLERLFEVAAHKISIPARPFLPVRQDGTLYPQEQTEILRALNDYLSQKL